MVYLIGTIVFILADGWGFLPFATGESPPPYACVIGVGGVVFALAALVIGVVGLRRGIRRAEAVCVLLGGLLYAPAVPLAAPGHLVGRALAGAVRRAAPAARGSGIDR